MSSKGTANTAAKATGAIAGLGVGVVIGAGVLLVEGFMLCGRIMKENSERISREWTDAYNRARPPSQEIQICMEFELACIASDDTYQHIDPKEQASQQSAEQQALLAQIQEVHSLFDATQTTDEIERFKRESVRNAAMQALKQEINMARDLLSNAEIVAAEVALGGTPDDMQMALRRLRNAEFALTEANAQQELKSRRTQQLMQELTIRLRSLDAMVADASTVIKTLYAKHRPSLAAQLQEIRERMAQSSGDALPLAEVAQQNMHQLTEIISAELVAAWDKARKKIYQLQGTLVSLNTMIEEAIASQLTTNDEVKDLARRIANTQRELQAALKDTSGAVQQQVKRLSERVDFLKEDVFSAVQVKQQQQIAHKVAETMTELGFAANDGSGVPTITANGDVVRVEAVRVAKEKTDNNVRDDKMVSFDITLDGDITYDFVGYVGDSCVAEADCVFAALRENGIFITNPEATAVLSKLPATQITEEILQQKQFQPRILPNKTQSLLAERLSGVLDQMGYPTIKQSSIGGTIELEAFKGAIGYHVLLSPEGTVQVYKGKERIDVTADQGEPLIQQLQEQETEIASQVSEEERAMQTHLTPRVQQMLGN